MSDRLVCGNLAGIRPVRHTGDMGWLIDGKIQEWHAPTPDGLARALAERHAGTVRFCHDANAWFIWDGVLWRRDRTDHVLHLIRTIARELGSDPWGATARMTGSMTYIVGVERFARAEPDLAVTAAVWDTDPWLLGTPDGTVDLGSAARSDPAEGRSTDLIPADPNDGLTRTTAVAPGAACPLWRRFLAETFVGDTELIGFVQRFCGYALTGATAEQVLVYGWGTGGNGKSVFLNTTLGVLGDYARPASFATLVAPDMGHGAALAALRGVRLVGVAESDGGWSERRLKMMTGGDAVPLPGGRDALRPCCKLLVMGNAPPALARVDQAIARRLRVVPFRHRPPQPDRDLEGKLRSEWPGILRWMIEGCRAWQANGLGGAAAIQAATTAVLEDQDPIGQFLLERCDSGPEHASRSVTAGALFAAWRTWAAAAGETAVSQRAFAVALADRGFHRERTSQARLYRGLNLRDAPAGDA